ncbi:hypothetical protein [Candidatus Nitrosocosmicus hydrocola]|uniref:hypothetical protein n=1 Tax=Candidatus Nitrosocosmicus hydrocola TaxID=1826872 RepID=UPI0011E5BDE4|nr:hypothetical protein [Candidatus Nitrosocosmicus hydrocola]
MTSSKFKPKNNTRVSNNKVAQKGKHASSTQSRRFVWENVIWPLVLDKNSNYFTLKDYHQKRNKVCRDNDVSKSKIAGGVVSLLNKGVLFRDKKLYSIHYSLIPYMRKRAALEYGLVLKQIGAKK